MQGLTSLKKNNYDVLERAWILSVQGRLIRGVSAGSDSAFDRITRELSTGDKRCPENVNVVGNYFMYHGSYIERNHFVVRVISIEAGDDHILTVTDTVRDDKTLGERNRDASGVLIFVEGQPQILLWGIENKRGLSLIIGSDTGVEKAALVSVVGSLAVMRPGGKTAYRRCLLRRVAGGVAADMVAESGIFPRGELDKPERLKHRQAFDILSRVTQHETFADPILSYQDGPV